VLARQFPQPAHVFVAIHALDRRERPRKRGFDAGYRKPDAHFPVVDRQNRRPANRRDRRVFRRFVLRRTHLSIIPACTAINPLFGTEGKR
jgi:hypothetical protein